MPCPKCYSHDLWDDYMWWGCNSCGWAGTEQNRLNTQDKFGPMTHKENKKGPKEGGRDVIQKKD